MAAGSSPSRAVRIEQDRVERLGRFEGGGIGHDRTASSLSRSRWRAGAAARMRRRRSGRPPSPARPPRRAVPSCRRARRRGRGPLAGLGRQDPCGQGLPAASCTHQAPSAKPAAAGSRCVRRQRIEPVGSRYRPAARPRGGIARGRKVDGGLAQVGGRDGARARLAIGGRPALAQPGGRVGHERIGSCEDRVPLGPPAAATRRWRDRRSGGRGHPRGRASPPYRRRRGSRS